MVIACDSLRLETDSVLAIIIRVLPICSPAYRMVEAAGAGHYK
jgi:hypothetical protein